MENNNRFNTSVGFHYSSDFLSSLSDVDLLRAIDRSSGVDLLRVIDRSSGVDQSSGVDLLRVIDRSSGVDRFGCRGCAPCFCPCKCSVLLDTAVSCGLSVCLFPLATARTCPFKEVFCSKKLLCFW